MAERKADPRLKRFWQWFDSELGTDADFEPFRKEVLSSQEAYPDDIQTRLEKNDPGLVLIDSRSTEEFAEFEHIAGAKNIPLDSLLENPGQLENWRDRTIVLVCNTGSTTSLYGTFFLRRIGFPEVYSLSQGIDGWIAAGGEVVNGAV